MKVSTNPRFVRAGCTRTRSSASEAAGKVSAATQAAHSEIPWRAMTGMRHRLIHGYADGDLDHIRMALRDDLAPLIATLERLVPRDGED